MAPATSAGTCTPSGTLPKSRAHRSYNAASITVAPPTVDAEEPPVREAGNFEHHDHVIPRSDASPNYEGVENLVIVCCHAIFHPDGSSPSLPLYSPYDERNWHLAPFQVSNPATGKPGEHETFVAHVLAGIDIVKRPTSKNDTLVVISGGPTKKALTPLSEAQSYYNAALAHELALGNMGGGRTRELFTKGRILLEEHATDSFQNFVFSILLFRRTTGVYPKHVRIITHAFKAKRFLHLHAPAIKWLPDRVQVQGIDPVMSKTDLEDTVRGEEMYGYKPWLKDPFGVGQELGQKRKVRGWDGEVAAELTEGLEESVKRLLNDELLYDDVLPWTKSGLMVANREGFTFTMRF
ncbi:hypothetical protein P280DRAFT_194590 [Massarina eburnea CBS 473.64]|uniref:DUF218 domain-containing protein n=1 Tax=Massarina eburnea CBS 473.64 TaxID=1395130 RepID=A0A6A6RML2_9PLEO|nr:hypothetical protein P280DRAFT_194590 [Massarina eburnea CBS 473.64]